MMGFFLSRLRLKYLQVAGRPHQDGSRFNGLQFTVPDGPRATCRCSSAEAFWKGDKKKVDVILAFICNNPLSRGTGNGEMNSPHARF